MKKQYAVFGLGSFGESVAITLQSLGCEVVAVDNHMERIEEIASKVSYAIKADVGDPEVIRSLGTRNLDGVVVAVADDMEASVMATLVSKDLGVPYVLAKAKTELHAEDRGGRGDISGDGDGRQSCEKPDVCEFCGLDYAVG